VLIVCIGGGFAVRQFRINSTVSAIEEKTDQSVSSITIRDGAVLLPDGVELDDLEGVSPEVLAIIIAQQSETANIIADMGKHDVEQVVKLGVNTQWAGAASDFSRALIVLGMLGLAGVGVAAGVYFSGKKDQA
jgi:hypothetical protein